MVPPQAQQLQQPVQQPVQLQQPPPAAQLPVAAHLPVAAQLPAAALPAQAPEAELAALLTRCVAAGALPAGAAAKYRFHFRRTLGPADQEIDLAAMLAYAADGDLAAVAACVRAALPQAA